MILFTSESSRIRRRWRRLGWAYAGITVFCILFGAVYEKFGHGVFSYYMIYAFFLPFVGGMLPSFYAGYESRKMIPMRGQSFWNFGIAVWTMGCFVKGILEIYGTTNRLLSVYWIVGGVSLLIGAGLRLGKHYE